MNTIQNSIYVFSKYKKNPILKYTFFTEFNSEYEW